MSGNHSPGSSGSRASASAGGKHRRALAWVLALAAFIVPRAVSLGKEALRIVVQAAPAPVDVEALTRDLRGLAHATVQGEDDSGERCDAEW